VTLAALGCFLEGQEGRPDGGSVSNNVYVSDYFRFSYEFPEGWAVASDGKLYLPSEDGDIFVVKAGLQYELLNWNEMGEILMASPAISDGMLIVRGRHHVFAIRAREKGAVGKAAATSSSPN
jgi:hypothetical protein